MLYKQVNYFDTFSPSTSTSIQSKCQSQQRTHIRNSIWREQMCSDRNTDDTMAQSDSMLTFNILKTAGKSTAGPRLGKLVTAGQKIINTPSYIGISSRGLVPHLSCDVLQDKTSIPGVYLALEDFIERLPNAVPPVFELPDDPLALKKFIGLATDSLLVLSPRRTPAVICPASNTATGISVLTSVGFHTLSNESYVDASNKLKTDITIGLGDVIFGAKTGPKRVEKMNDRTTDWTQAMIQALKENGSSTSLFAPILALDAQQQSFYLDFLEESIQDISGLALYSSHVLISLPSAISHLPRLALTEPATPHALLSDIGLGMDIHTIPFITSATEAGVALSFTFPVQSKSESVPAPLGSNMWLPTHSTSLIPLAPDCGCYACSRHHRAYIQHLLVAKEMLGWVLLQIHNFAIIDRFYEGIRTSIENQTFKADVGKFEQFYDSLWPEVTGMGPRVRGYQYKSEGPGEEKRNAKGYNRFDDSEPAGTTQKDASIRLDDSGPLVPTIDSAQLEGIGFAEK